MATVIKPKPGMYKGVRYRSQLEIKWAEWLLEHCPDKWSVAYVDASDCDFVTSHHSSAAPWHYMEVKPPVAELCRAALTRLVFSVKQPGETWTLLIGNPPSPYGVPWLVHCHFITTSHIYGPHSELSAVLRCNMQDVAAWPPAPHSVEVFDECVIPLSLWDEHVGDESDCGGWLIDNIIHAIGYRSKLSETDSWGG